MKKVLLLSALLCTLVVMEPGLASAVDQQPEMIAEKMAIKFTMEAEKSRSKGSC